MHTDLKRPEMWLKLITEKTTEALPVVSISLDSVSPAHLAVKKNQRFRSKAVTKDFDVFEIRFLGIYNRRTSK